MTKISVKLQKGKLCLHILFFLSVSLDMWLPSITISCFLKPKWSVLLIDKKWQYAVMILFLIFSYFFLYVLYSLIATLSINFYFSNFSAIIFYSFSLVTAFHIVLKRWPDSFWKSRDDCTEHSCKAWNNFSKIKYKYLWAHILGKTLWWVHLRIQRNISNSSS